MTKTSSGAKKVTPFTLFLRYAGSDKPAAAVLAAARQRGLPVMFPADQAPPADSPDYALIDPTLSVAPSVDAAAVPPPAPGLAYSGFSPEQRAAYHAWIENPAVPAPPAFQQLLLANAEMRLLEGDAKASITFTALRSLAAAPAWQGSGGLARTLLLGFWLRADGPGLAEMLIDLQPPTALWPIALGCQALLGQALRTEQLPGIAAAWNMPLAPTSPAVLRLRLDSLQTALGEEPLAHALAALGDGAKTPLPWRCQHRDLRLAFPQPNVRGALQPLLDDLLTLLDEAQDTPGFQGSGGEETTDEFPAAVAPPAKASKGSKKEPPPPASELEKAHIIVEFGASRSDVFTYVLRQAQKQPGFQQIMDENRHIIYRVPFRRSEMRRFWHLWDYVQGWATTRVYCDGRQLDKWQIYPYSQYLR
ncbi:MAG: hypothetical protein U0X20_19145 [Caldilineaceae bacterium]